MAKEKTDKKNKTDEQVVDLNVDRLSDIEMLAEQMETDRDKEMTGETDISDDESKEEQVDEEQEEEVDEESETSDEELESEDEQEEEETEINDEFDTLVIDGKEQKVSKDEIYEAGKRAKQKELAVDETLERVKKLERDLEEQKRSTQTFKPQTQTQPQPFEADLKEAEEALDNSRRAYAKAQSDLDEEAIYQESINVHKAEERVAGIKKERSQQVYRQQKMVKIQEKFVLPPEEGGLSDVWNDEDAKAIAARYADKKINEGADPFTFDVYEESANYAREKLGWVKKEQEEEVKTPEANALEQKKAKKKAATKQTATPNNQKTKSTKQSDKPMTREQIKQSAYDEIAGTRSHLAIT